MHGIRSLLLDTIEAIVLADEEIWVAGEEHFCVLCAVCADDYALDACGVV